MVFRPTATDGITISVLTAAAAAVVVVVFISSFGGVVVVAEVSDGGPEWTYAANQGNVTNVTYDQIAGSLGRRYFERPTLPDVSGSYNHFIYLPSYGTPWTNASGSDDVMAAPESRTKRHLAEGSDDGSPAPVYRCGGFINASRGVISTPNFPGRFPVPIHCRWILYAPPGRKIVLYFTQFYLREAFRVAEYDLYSSEDLYVGKDDLGVISFEETTWLMGYKPYMVLTFDVRELGNIHLRVESFLLDVYGFNITFELIGEKESARDDGCSVVECSFLGNCLVSQDFKYQCHCFEGYYGDECQYGPYCDPELEINLCKNGGRCRYFYGSMVNTCECPPMYEGSQCEIRKADYISSACEDLQCSQLCVEYEKGGYMCDCREGHRLAPDGKTCLSEAEGRLRFYIQMRVNAGHSRAANYSQLFGCPNVQEAFINLLNKILSDITHDNITLINLSRVGEYVYINFYFMGLKDNKDDIWLKMQGMVYQTSLCSLPMDSDYLVFDAQPASLRVITLRNYDDKPSIEGNLLTLFCKAKGSQHLTFTWLKDGQLVDVHKTERNMWESRIPTYDGETHISVLNIEKAQPLDEGEFTCVASDWGKTDSRSVHVFIIPKPRMRISPMTITAEPGTDTAISCLSRDDYKTSQFKYTWQRDGVPLVPGHNEEIVEDMLPRGSRVKLTASRSAVYTCVVQSEAGQSQDSSHLFILRGDDVREGRLCLAESFQGVKWQTTMVNHIDVEPCPKLSEGKARRRCVCEAETCYWEEPNFAGCTSLHLDAIEQHFKSLILGYQTSNLSHHIAELNEFLDFEIRNRTYLRAGDLDKAIIFLMDIQQYAYRFLSPQAKKSLYNKIFLTLDKLLDMCQLIADDEIRELDVTTNVMKLVENIRRDLIYFAASLTYESRHLTVRVQQGVTCKSDSLRLYKSNELEMWIENNTDLCNSDVASYVVNYQDTGLVLNISSPLYYRNSDLVYVGLHSRDYDVRGLELYIRYLNNNALQQNEVNRSICALWEADLQGGRPHWSESGCTTLENTVNYTTCKCVLPGHYVLFTEEAHSETTEATLHDEIIHLPMLICLIIAQCGFVVSLSVQIICWRSSVGEPRLIAITFILSLIVICSLLLCGITHQDEQVVCLVLKLSLYFIILVALCARLAEAVSLYTISLNTHAEFVYTKSLATFVELFIVIGIPLIVFVPVPIVGNVKGFSDDGGLFCWIVPDDWEFYGLVIPSGILLTVFMLLISLAMKNNCTSKTLTLKQNRSRFRFYLLRCAISQVLLCMAIITSVLFNQYSTLTFEWLHGSFMMLLALFTLITLHPKVILRYSKKKQTSSCLVCSVQESAPCVNDCTEQCCALAMMNPKMPHTTSNSSFKVFVRPQYNHSEFAEVGADEALRRDRHHYTREKKEQLVALLGQSSGSDSSKESQVTSSSADGGRCVGSEPDASDNRTAAGASPRTDLGGSVGARSRHHANSLCSCSNCGTRYPFRPARGQSLIAVNADPETADRRPPATLTKNATYSGSPAACVVGPDGARRQSMPDPFPELSDSPPRSDSGAGSRTTSPAGSARDKRRSRSGSSRVTFHLGDAK